VRYTTLPLGILILCAACFALGRYTGQSVTSASQIRYTRAVKSVILKTGTDCRVRQSRLHVIGQLRLPKRPVSVDYAWSPTGTASWEYSGADGSGPIDLFSYSKGFSRGRTATTRVSLSFEWRQQRLTVYCISKRRLGPGVRVQYDVVYPS